MKKITPIITGLIALFLIIQIQSANAQYTITNSALDVGNPGGLRTVIDGSTSGETIILAYNAGSDTTNKWSNSITIPFSFKFNGVPVTQFCVNKNGLLTFTNSVAGTNVDTALNTNTALPNTSLPNNTICYFWEDFASTPLDANDDIYTSVVGNAPHRQFWVRNHSYKLGSMAFSYFALVFEEFTNDIHIVDMNRHSSNCTATVAIQINSTTAYQVSSGLNSAAGSPNIIMGDGYSNPADNEYYTFMHRVPNDAGISLLKFGNPCIGLNSVEVELINYGSNTLSSAKIHWSINGIVQPSTLSWTGSISSNQSTLVTIGNYIFNTATTYNIKAWTTLPNSLVDSNNINDSAYVSGIQTGISGIYTINPGSPAGGTNFMSFSSAIAFLSANRLCGPIVFDVASGIYNEQITIGNIPGSSSINTITFQSTTGNKNNVILGLIEKTWLLFFK